MKIEIDYIKQILDSLEDCDNNDYPSLNYLMKSLNISMSHGREIIKLRFHLNILKDGGFVECISDDFGISTGMNGDLIINSSVGTRITLLGAQLLESLKNDTIWNKSKVLLKEISVETLKQIPGLALNILMSFK
ncbi:DUF2513 domain-containing protein [Opitutia bacterium KCR 482]|nr:DUF2513 domain-containing protein [Opitutae bacterium KCR 482]